MSTCSGLAALDYANTKFSRGYSTTGVGMGVCARHEFVQANGMGDLQKGERYFSVRWPITILIKLQICKYGLYLALSCDTRTHAYGKLSLMTLCANGGGISWNACRNFHRWCASR